ncbi:UNVERIFIED_CONTAM: hypothetical protein Slati_2644800 [Sesamum latifolium]|uniref:FRIGIDA-like protein n=1 Tax=Sesamum latifolium TaxID=2727402 RepID=A0AAW2VUI1_9LAMI
MAGQSSLHNRVAELESQIQRVLELLGHPPDSPPTELFSRVDTLHSRAEMLQKNSARVAGCDGSAGQAVQLPIGTASLGSDGLKASGVKNLPSAIAAADRLVDFRVTSGSHLEKKKDFGNDKWKSGEVGKDENFKKKKNKERMWDCPKRGKLNALVAEADEDDWGGSSRVNPLCIKAVNSEAKLIQCVACVDLKHSIRSAEKKDSLMSALQVKNDLRHEEQTYLVALIEIKSNVVQKVPDEVEELLEEFKDVFPPELPRKLPPRRAIDHAIELEPGARPPA